MTSRTSVGSLVEGSTADRRKTWRKADGHAQAIVVMVGVALGVLALLAGNAGAWYSPINTNEYYAPPGPPGSNPYGTACRVDSMNGNYAGTAFAKLRMDTTKCADVTLYVV